MPHIDVFIRSTSDSQDPIDITSLGDRAMATNERTQRLGQQQLINPQDGAQWSESRTQHGDGISR
jgi:hypothetical protein